MSRSARRSELVVHAGAQEIGVERHVVGDEPAAAIQSAIEATEIDIEILDLGRPVGRESGLQPGADRPTAIVTIRMLLQAGSSISAMVELSP
jgi:hypothetical protein